MLPILHKSILSKQLIAVFLLGLFSLAITPKKTLHNLLANHKDGAAKKTSTGKDLQINIAGFNCKCDNLVAESAFVAGTTFTIVSSLSIYQVFNSSYKFLISLPHFIFNLRGPPVNF